MTTKIHEWMDQSAYNYTSRVDNTIDEGRFQKACAAHFPNEDIKAGFWSWPGWGTDDDA